MPVTKPSLELLRSLTDEHVLRALMEEPRLTRAELATRTGLSKPTISEGVRRLGATGLVADTGERTTGRGRAGSYYALAGDVGTALVVSVAPEGVVAEVLDAHGAVTSRHEEPIARPARPARVTRSLRACVTSALDTSPAGPPRLAVVSAADPVSRSTGRLVHLPDAPFLLGELSPVEVLAELLGLDPQVVTVDNDVNWAARAEQALGPTGAAAASGATSHDDIVYLHLGEGLGCAVVSDGEVRRGHEGFVGEIAHVTTAGRGGRAVAFTEVFAELGLRHEGSTSIDVDALLAAVAGSDRPSRSVCRQLATAVGGVLAAVVALADPAVVVLGGTWGAHPAVLAAVDEEFGRQPRRVALRAARVTQEPSLVGARVHAVEGLRSALVAAAREAGSGPGDGRPTAPPPAEGQSPVSRPAQT